MVAENVLQEQQGVDLNPQKLIKSLNLEGKLRRQLNQMLVGLKKGEQVAEIRRLYPELLMGEKDKRIVA